MQGAHQCLELWISHSEPLISKDPQFVQFGGGGDGMWLNFSSSFVLQNAHSAVGLRRLSDHMCAAGFVLQCAHIAHSGG